MKYTDTHAHTHACKYTHTHTHTLKVVQNHPQVPDEWKSDQSQARSFAVFYEAHVKKGTYKMNKGGQVRLFPSANLHYNYIFFSPF